MLATAIRAYYTMECEEDDGRILRQGFHSFAVYVVVIFSVQFFLVMPFRRDQRILNHSAALGAVRTVITAEVGYQETYKAGYSRTLDALKPPAADSSPSATAAGLVDEELASGKKEGYRFAYTPGAPDAAGSIKKYTILAMPLEYGQTGCRSLFSDDTGVIHQTEESRPASAQDALLER